VLFICGPGRGGGKVAALYNHEYERKDADKMEYSYRKRISENSSEQDEKVSKASRNRNRR